MYDNAVAHMSKGAAKCAAGNDRALSQSVIVTPTSPNTALLWPIQRPCELLQSLYEHKTAGKSWLIYKGIC